MNQNLNELSEAELADWHYAHREELEADEGELVEAQVSPQFSVTMSFRLPGVEADAIRESARAAGMSLSEWIRQACADAVEPKDDSDRRQQVDMELVTAEKQLDAMRRRLEAARQKNRRLSVDIKETQRLGDVASKKTAQAKRQTVEQGFDKLQASVDATAKQMAEARRHHDALRASLDSAADVVDVFQSGSFARGTSISPIRDLDVVAVFDASEHPDWGKPGGSARAALERARDLVKLPVGSGDEDGVRKTRLRSHAIRCFMNDPDSDDPFTVDVVPALQHRERGLWIPEVPRNDPDSGNWIRTDPQHLIRVTLARHAEWSQFRNLVRVLKSWNGDHGHHMNSLAVEVLALKHLPAQDRPTALARFFVAAQEAIWQPIRDPAELCGEIQPDLDPQAASDALATAARHSRAALEAAAQGQDDRAMCLWRMVFGANFPEPESGCARQGGANPTE